MRTGELGYWWRSLGGPPARRPPLVGSTEADVAIVGAGYTGLWTAYYLKLAEPPLRIVVLEREMAGFGASGRNGGLAALQRAMFATVDEVGRVLERHHIDADFILSLIHI